MTKSHRRTSKSSKMMKSIKTTTEKALPVVNKTLTTVGETTKDVAVKSVPVIEKGVSVVYGTLATGFDLGIKGATNVAKGVKKLSKKNKTRKSKKSKRGGRKTRRH
jgi:hypothetical protein